MDTIAHASTIESNGNAIAVRYCKKCNDWIAIKRGAVMAKRGLWQDDAPVECN